jgi:hypothetical protein
MGGSRSTYNPPPPDDTFKNYLKYQQEREATAQARADQVTAENKAEAAARKAAGAAGYGGLKKTTQQQLSQGLIGYESAANQLRDYAAKYELNAQKMISRSLLNSTLQHLPGKRATGNLRDL